MEGAVQEAQIELYQVDQSSVQPQEDLQGVTSTLGDNLGADTEEFS